MFFVKHAGKSKLAPVIQPLTAAELLMKINDDGLFISKITKLWKVTGKSRTISLSWPMPAMWQPWQMLVFKDDPPDPALFAFHCKDTGFDESRAGL